MLSSTCDWLAVLSYMWLAGCVIIQMFGWLCYHPPFIGWLCYNAPVTGWLWCLTGDWLAVLSSICGGLPMLSSSWDWLAVIIQHATVHHTPPRLTQQSVPSPPSQASQPLLSYLASSISQANKTTVCFIIHTPSPLLSKPVAVILYCVINLLSPVMKGG